MIALRWIMNSKTKRRLGVVTGIIVIVAILVLAIVGGNSAAKTVSVAEALELTGDNKIQVTGNVAENSFSIDGDVLTFQIYDVDADPAAAHRLNVRYDGGVSATFGNDVTAICTGKKNADGVLNCSELVTKCPSKYENAEGALTMTKLLEYGDSVVNKPVKLAGVIKQGTLAGVDAEDRFTLTDPDTGYDMLVKYDGALPNDMAEGSSVVLTGSIAGDHVTFTATDVAMKA